MSEASNPYKQAAKAIKAKGLLKLKFYCQMCQKQCRDAAGFKAHTLSESHHRQMQVFRANPARFINQFSEEFKKGFLDILRTRHAKKKVPALKVYNEYINDRHHVHMNSTRWTTLSSFVKYLGKIGVCYVEYDEEKDSWLIQYLGETNTYNPSGASSSNTENDEVLDERRKFDLYERQFQALKELEEQADQIIKEESGNESKTSSSSSDTKQNKKPSFSGFTLTNKRSLSQTTSDKNSENSTTLSNDANHNSKKTDSNATQKNLPVDQDESIEQNESEAIALDSNLIQQTIEPATKKKKIRKDADEDDSGLSSGWLKTGIVVKIIDETSEFYNKKGLVIKTLKKKRQAQVELLDNPGQIIEVYQDNLQTVIPKIGGKVTILKHETMRGKSGTLLSVDFDKGCATVQVDGVLGENQLVLNYDEFSKLF
ncbi:hypothetical protein FDP41_012094 [Naegleria fowleri]|uniref:C2H2-type domain-containing protein n=1 Tax=Naegleria fowleri TaxID=5763 RepID=A0A6A5BW21_NAEFO|nr:uncharacterized protein FDP41_012094 [Naegleria fowleri]KAF0981437.1 hypothetical protein FDP41_012094 [Naegleria fowleri]CAG4716225.1 unnamed protein product [Naegleria fowleri]